MTKCYDETLGEIGGHKAHELPHTHYKGRKRFVDEGFAVAGNAETSKLDVCVCVGTSCHVRGSQVLMEKIVGYVKQQGLEQDVQVKGTFCFEACDKGPTVRVGDTVINKCSLEMVTDEITKALKVIC